MTTEPGESITAPDEAPVTYERDDAGVATITLNRPKSMNSLDTATKDALKELVLRAAEDPAVRCVVLTGRGRAFCVGQDLREHAHNIATTSMDEVWSTVERHYGPTALALATMAKPVIAAVNGTAAGAGLSLAMACDLRVAADTAVFTTAFTGIGLSCDTGSSWTLPRLVGQTTAMEMMLLPRPLSASEALAAGLVTTVVSGEDLASTVAELAARLASGPTRAYAAVKRSLAFGASHDLAAAVSFEAEMMAWTGSSDDHRNAVEAFVAKRQPTFDGR